MISYDPFWRTLKAKKVTAYRLREYHGIAPSTLTRMRRNEYLSVRTIEDFCKILGCRVEDIVEYIPDPEPSEAEDIAFQEAMESKEE